MEKHKGKFIVIKAIKNYIKEKGKQCSNDFLVWLDLEVGKIIDGKLGSEGIKRL